MEIIQAIYMSLHELLNLNILLTCFFLVSQFAKIRHNIGFVGYFGRETDTNLQC